MAVVTDWRWAPTRSARRWWLSGSGTTMPSVWTGAFIIDLSDVGFLDSSGLHVLLRARSLLGREDRALAVICRPGPVRRVLELSGTADLFYIYGSREDAAAALVPSE
jgi:hypothetical protein